MGVQKSRKSAKNTKSFSKLFLKKNYIKTEVNTFIGKSSFEKKKRYIFFLFRRENNKPLFF